ncbi:AcrR family transcriptional regulator [Nocardioides ginsengisegetis]|uniref:AcrR family transcriptional regulator n=1 Tax=Nocardioides ginsengisegetis TaxID=661491 RepID=A0A7W3J273_9ACTN|nr:TetR/AcrR family transcriptional regulator [Nocardioides ginsengisegetis]MBA8804955.1 AcrR family transcriptional regulator [Nocardioides ginsengisegetis]
MAKATEQTSTTIDSEGSWRDRALERSLATAKAKAVSRSDRFIATAMEILEETGRSDFTVQELVDRSRTSLRSFYQYFSGKDELLLALLEESIAQSVAAWRERVDGQDTLTALKTVVTSIYGGAKDGAGVTGASGLNRGLAPYHVGLADSHHADYQRAVAPMARLIHELINRGVEEGVIRTDLPADKLTAVFIQAVIGAALFTALSNTEADRKADADAMWEFCRLGLVGAEK